MDDLALPVVETDGEDDLAGIACSSVTPSAPPTPTELRSSDIEADSDDASTLALPPPEFPPEHWIPNLAARFGLQRPYKGKQLHVATFCSGTDSVMHAAQQAFGVSNLRHLVSIDRDPLCRKFIKANFAPEHLFHSTGDLHDSEAYCETCFGTCTFLQEMHGKNSIDVLLAGFPCPPYSLQRVGRRRADDDPFDHPGVQPFFDIVKFLKSCAEAPRVVILENVEGVLKGSRGHPPPGDFLMWGKVGRTKIGLGYLSQYHVSSPFTVDAINFGLPVHRPRVLWILLRKDLFSEADLRVILNRMAGIQLDPVEMQPISKFIGDYGLAPLIKRQRLNDEMSADTVSKCDAFRAENNLPHRDAPGGRPFSDLAVGSELYPARELELIDLAILLAEQSAVPYEKVIVDLSQSIDRLKVRLDGTLNTVTTGSRIFYLGTQRLLTHEDMFCLMGWRRNYFVIPEDASNSAVWKLIGNMWCPPVAGAAMMCIFALGRVVDEAAAP